MAYSLKIEGMSCLFLSVTLRVLSVTLRVILLINGVLFENRRYVTPVFERHTESRSANQWRAL